MHEHCADHVKSQRHLDAMKAAKSFLEDTPVDIQMVSSHNKILAENRKFIASMASLIMFCGKHDLALRGKKT